MATLCILRVRRLGACGFKSRSSFPKSRGGRLGRYPVLRLLVDVAMRRGGAGIGTPLPPLDLFCLPSITVPCGLSIRGLTTSNVHRVLMDQRLNGSPQLHEPSS